MAGISGRHACGRLGICGMIPKMIAHIEVTGQEVLGNLRFETVVTDAGWKLDDKGHQYWQRKKYMYLPNFEVYQPLKHFRGTTRIIVNNKFDFVGYHDGNTCLIAYEPVDKLHGEQEE